MKLLLEKIVSSAFLSAQNDEKYKGIACELYSTAIKPIINSRAPDLKFSDIEPIKDKYEKLPFKEVEIKIDFSDDFSNIDVFNTKIGKYDHEKNFHEIPKELTYFNSVLEKYGSELETYMASRYIVKDVKAESKGNEYSIDAYIEELNTDYIDTHIYIINHTDSIEVLKRPEEDNDTNTTTNKQYLTDNLYELCFYWKLTQIEHQEVKDFLNYQLENSFGNNIEFMSEFINNTLYSYKELYGFLSKANAKIYKNWSKNKKQMQSDKPTKEKIEENTDLKIRESLFGKKALYIVFFEALRETNILSDKTSNAAIARLINNSWGLKPNQVEKKWKYEIELLEREPQLKKRTEEIEKILNGLKEIEKVLKIKYRIK